MGKLVKKNNIIFYQLEESGTDDLYRIQGELGVGIWTVVEQKVVMKLTSNDIGKLGIALQENDISGDTLKDMCRQFHQHMLENSPGKGEKEFFFATEYK